MRKVDLPNGESFNVEDGDSVAVVRVYENGEGVKDTEITLNQPTEVSVATDLMMMEELAWLRDSLKERYRKWRSGDEELRAE